MLTEHRAARWDDDAQQLDAFVPTVDVLGIPIHRLTQEQLLKLLRNRKDSGLATWLVTANAELIVRAGDNPVLARELKKADLLVADGSGVVWAARALGSHLPQRLPGVEIAEELVKWAAREGLTIYFLGAKPGVAAAAVAKLRSRYPSLSVAGIHHGYFSESEEQEIMREIKYLEPDILLVALGAPRQELWLAEHFGELRVPVAVGVGGTFDVWAGRVKRAPIWMSNMGLEWLYRLMVEPWRARRMVALPHFVHRVMRAKFRGR